MKRYCKFLKLRDNDALIREYIKEHKSVWSEIKEGIKEVGIIDMEIYLHEHYAFMIMETEEHFDPEKDGKRLATLPRQTEWETYMSRFQQSDKNASSYEKWEAMNRIFKL